MGCLIFDMCCQVCCFADQEDPQNLEMQPKRRNVEEKSFVVEKFPAKGAAFAAPRDQHSTAECLTWQEDWGTQECLWSVESGVAERGFGEKESLPGGQDPLEAWMQASQLAVQVAEHQYLVTMSQILLGDHQDPGEPGFREETGRLYFSGQPSFQPRLGPLALLLHASVAFQTHDSMFLGLRQPPRRYEICLSCN